MVEDHRSITEALFSEMYTKHCKAIGFPANAMIAQSTRNRYAPPKAITMMIGITEMSRTLTVSHYGCLHSRDPSGVHQGCGPGSVYVRQLQWSEGESLGRDCGRMKPS